MLLKEYNAKEEKSFEDILEFHVKFERIHPFQDGSGRVGRLLMFKECLKYNIVPFIVEDSLKMFYYRGLKEWDLEKGYLLDTCLAAQDANCLKRAMDENDLLNTKVLEYNTYLYQIFFQNFSVTKEMLEKESLLFKSRINRDIIVELIGCIPNEWKPKQKDLDELVSYILYRVDNLDVIISTIMTYYNR